MEDDSTMDCSRDDEGLLRSGGHRVEGYKQSVKGMSIGGVRYEYNSEEYLEATRMDLEGSGKAPTSC